MAVVADTVSRPARSSSRLRRDTVSRDQLAADYLGLALQRARKVGPECGLPVDEAESAALVGLAEAIDRYEPGRATAPLTPFVPFALVVIDGRIKDAARAWSWRRRATELEGREMVTNEQLVAMIPERLTTAELVERRTDIAAALAALTAQERQVVVLHGQLGHSLTTVSAMLEVETEHCRYIWRRALDKMRVELGAV